MKKSMLWFLVTILLVPAVYAQDRAGTPQPKVRFVSVDEGVRLEVLDWGGTGTPLIFLAGLGNTAHDIERFAVKFTPKYHVYGFTRRGFGESSKPDPVIANYSGTRLGDDVLAVIDALKLNRPVLVGHSVAGEELSSVGSRHPEKIAGLVYLEAGYGYAYYDRVHGDLFLDLIDAKNLIDKLETGTAQNRKQLFLDIRADVSHLAKSLQEITTQMASMPNAPPPQSPLVRAIQWGEERYTEIHVPILAIFAVSPDPDSHAAQQIDAFAAGLPSARVVRIKNATHFIFDSNEEQVVREMDLFLAGLVEPGRKSTRPMRRSFLHLAALLQPPSSLPTGYSPPGRFVNVGERKLHLYCTGRGEPTVILMAGGNAYSIDWALVQPAIAASTRVCSYDRAGLAWSDSGPADETVEQTVSDLHIALRNTGEKGPFILVGASIGGIFIQAFQRSFPGEVAALVFSNSSNRIGINVRKENGIIWNLTEEDVRSAFPLPASVKQSAPSREGEPFDRLPLDLQQIRLWLDIRSWQKWEPSKITPESLLSLRKEFLEEFKRANSVKHPLGQLPVVVLSSFPEADSEDCKSHKGAAACLDALSSNSVHIVAPGSGHEIHLYRPDIVVEGILRTVSSLRKGKEVPLR